MTVTVTCVRCDNYEYVDGPDGNLRPCPTCGPEIVTCPIHTERVMMRGGVLVGRCWGCAEEAARGLQWMQLHPPKNRRRVAA